MHSYRVPWAALVFVKEINGALLPLFIHVEEMNSTDYIYLFINNRLPPFSFIAFVFCTKT